MNSIVSLLIVLQVTSVVQWNLSKMVVTFGITFLGLNRQVATLNCITFNLVNLKEVTFKRWSFYAGGR